MLVSIRYCVLIKYFSSSNFNPPSKHKPNQNAKVSRIRREIGKKGGKTIARKCRAVFKSHPDDVL